MKKNNITLIGMPTSGKSTVGVILAKILGMDFVDTDLIILDPPRDGIHPKALPKLLAYGPERFIYVSCKPTSLVRDLPAFTQAGYEITRIGCCDMFPFTPHVETVCLLTHS